MKEQYAELLGFLKVARRRWRALEGLRVWSLAATAAAIVLGLALIAHHLFKPDGLALVALWVTAIAAAAAGALWLLRPLRHVPGFVQVARFIEERCPDLEDTLATAVAEGEQPDGSPMVAVVVRDAVGRVRDFDPGRIVHVDALRTVAARAALATLALAVIVGFSTEPGGRALRLLALYAFPGRLFVDVSPGDARIRAGETLKITTHLRDAGDGVVPVIRIEGAGGRREVRMDAGASGYGASFQNIQQGFRYRVAAAGTSSREYTVTVLRPPHVDRIDLRYEYPPPLRMMPRVEEDGGDIYGPEGTQVSIAVHPDKKVKEGTITTSDGARVPLTVHGDVLEGSLTIAADGSYRVALVDADGLLNPGETEYFIRTLQDRPPDVHIVRPAADTQVTPIEEVTVDARADDDFGIAAFDLVYAVRGGREVALPFRREGSALTQTGRTTIYLEDLAVQPGDFVAFYARARDVGRGKGSSESRSDIFFLEVKPFEEEFVAASSQAGGSGGDRALDDLVQAQKDVISATWKLDRRARESGGRSADDIRAVARAQEEIRRRVLGASLQNQRSEELRRRLRGQRTRGRVSDSSDDAMTKALEAMARAQQELEALRTSPALPHEMAALNELLRAQAEVRRREVQRQEANSGSGSGSNRQTQDLSSLFDRELARQQQTNYETPNSSETRANTERNDAALERIRELARRQEALNREQEELTRNRAMPEEEMRRQLERLTREQSELRQQAEELSRQLQQQGRGQPQQGRQEKGQQRANSNQQQDAGRAMQEVSEDMRSAASGMRRQDRGQASSSGNRALGRLRDLERQMQGAQPDRRRRELGELQLETRQLAEAERRLGSDARQERPASESADAARRRSGEQERLAERMQKVEESVRRLAGEQQDAQRGSAGSTIDDAARELERQKLAERMRNLARQDRERAASGANTQPGRGRVPDEQEIARALDRLGERLGAAAGQDGDQQRLSEELARVRELRDRLAEIDRQLAERGREGGRGESAGNRNGRSSGDQQGRAGGRGSNTNGEWEQARELIRDLQREREVGLSNRDVQGFNPGLSAPGTETWKQDYTRWEQLKTQIAAALEKLEATAAERLRDQQAKDRLNAGATQAVPEQYRELVDKYYRALASRERK